MPAPFAAPRPAEADPATSAGSAGRASATPSAVDATTLGLLAEHERAQQLLLARGYVQFHTAVAQRVGFKAALMLGHALYWTRHWLAKQPQRDGWFWKTAREWSDATGLSAREQESARAALRDAGLWAEQIAGAPARLYFRVDLAVLTAHLRETVLTQGLPVLQGDDVPLSPDRPEVWTVLAALTGRPIHFYRPLADIAGGAAAGLVLSELLSAYRQALASQSCDKQGFFAVSLDNGREALGLGTKVPRNALEALQRGGLVQKAYTAGQRPRLMLRLNLVALLACLSGQSGPPLRRRQRSSAERAATGAGHSIPRAPEPAPLQGTLIGSAWEEPGPDRARVVARHGNVAQVTRLLVPVPRGAGSKRVAAMAPLPALQAPGLASSGAIRHQPSAATPVQQALSDVEGCPFVETGPEVGRFVETDVRPALLLKLELPFCRSYIQKEFNQSITPPPARVREDVAAVDKSGQLGRRGLESPESQQPEDPPDATQNKTEGDEVDTDAALVFPAALDQGAHRAAMQVLQSVPQALRQSLLDELAGAMASPRTSIHNPVAWLMTLAGKANKGTLVLTLADQVAATRRSRAAREAHLAALASMPMVKSPAPVTTGTEAATTPAVSGEAAKQRLQVLRAEMAAKAARSVGGER
jgi:hypothetical protein